MFHMGVLVQVVDAVGIERINVATYQAVSGAGRSAIEELVRQATLLLNGRPLEIEGPTKQIAFNALPHIDTFQDSGVAVDEMVACGVRDDCIVLVGGAPLNEEFGEAIGADAYCRDAATAVDTARELVGSAS